MEYQHRFRMAERPLGLGRFFLKQRVLRLHRRMTHTGRICVIWLTSWGLRPPPHLRIW